MSKKKDPDKKVMVPKPELSRRPEPRYSRGELIEAASSFGVKPEVMAGALKLTSKDTMTKAEAEKAIKDFLKRRV